MFYGVDIDTFDSMPVDENGMNPAEAAYPEFGLIMAEIIKLYNDLSDERQYSMGMNGAIPQAITRAECWLCYQTEIPMVDFDHFYRVVKSADRAWRVHQAKKSNK